MKITADIKLSTSAKKALDDTKKSTKGHVSKLWAVYKTLDDGKKALLKLHNPIFASILEILGE